MRFNQLQHQPTQSFTVQLSGGVNELDSFSTMRPGELIGCFNYQSVSGSRSGYESIPGYEVIDGQTAPSSIPIISFVDKGNDQYTTLLLNADTGFTDVSQTNDTIINNGVVISTSRYKFSDRSFYFNTNTNLAISPRDFSGDFAIDFWISPHLLSGIQTIFEQETNIKIYLDNSFLKIELSDDGISYTHLISGSQLAAGFWTHIALTSRDGICSLYINGGLLITEAVILSGDFTGPAVIGGGNIRSYLSCFRISQGSPRFIKNFVPYRLPYNAPAFLNEEVDDFAREAARSSVEPVPGDGPISGGFLFGDDLYVVRDDLDEDCGRVFKATPLGWLEISQPESYLLKVGGNLRVVVHKFEGFNQNENVAILVDGVSVPRLFDGTVFTPITDGNLPTDVLPNLAGVYDNRLWLSYSPPGSIFFSGVGDPTNYSAYFNAGELLIGEDVTNILEGPNNILIITTKKSIEILKRATVEDDILIFQKEVFARNSGAYYDSAQLLLGDIYFASTEGVLSLQRVEAYGDFSLGAISRKVNKTYAEFKDILIGSMVDREKSQYKLFFSNGRVLCFDFNTEKFVRSVTQFDYQKVLTKVFVGLTTTGYMRKFFISDDGFVYEFDKGTSFNGNYIPTYFKTAPHHYGGATVWKRFRKFIPDIVAPFGVTFYIKSFYSYGDKLIKESLVSDETISEFSGSPWGVGVWGVFVWGGLSITTVPFYLSGFGTSLSVAFKTNEKYKEPHTIQSLVVDYSVGKRRI